MWWRNSPSIISQSIRIYHHKPTFRLLETDNGSSHCVAQRSTLGHTYKIQCHVGVKFVSKAQTEMIAIHYHKSTIKLYISSPMEYNFLPYMISYIKIVVPLAAATLNQKPPLQKCALEKSTYKILCTVDLNDQLLVTSYYYTISQTALNLLTRVAFM